MTYADMTYADMTYADMTYADMTYVDMARAVQWPKPVVVEVYDGGVLRELADNPQQFKEIVSDIFREFDEDGSGTLSRLELKPAFVSLGLVPPSAHTEVDALLSRVIGKYGGSDLQVDEGEFELMLGDMVKELSEELACRPIILSAEKKPVFTGSFVRQLTGDSNRFDAVASQLFMEWDILHRGRLSRTGDRNRFDVVESQLFMEWVILKRGWLSHSPILCPRPPIQLTGDRNRFDAVASQLFMEWDILHRGRLSRTEIILGFKKCASSFEVQMLTPGEAEELWGVCTGVPNSGKAQQLHKDSLNAPFPVPHPPLCPRPPIQLTGDRNRFDAVASQLFMEWDILHRGRLSRTEIILGFKKYASSFEVQLLSPSEAEELCARVFSKADEDHSGFVEFDEFDGVLKELLNGMAKKLDRNPVVTTSGIPSPGSFSTCSQGTQAKGQSKWCQRSISSHISTYTSPFALASHLSPFALASHTPSRAAKEPEPVVPKQRSVADIKAAHNYKSKLPPAGSAGAAAADARNKLVERGEKISKLNDMADELEADTAEFSDLAAQLKKKMEKKWW
ncbi:unnamed protein product [Closterium sp. Naga37s-1]|nr:unnamed protein product [Closterium sp. Naga37s-1]